MKQVFYFDGKQLKRFGERTEIKIHNNSFNLRCVDDVSASHQNTFLVAYNRLPTRTVNLCEVIAEQIDEIDKYILKRLHNFLGNILMYGELK